ncbi:ribonuclease M5 [Pullulanibacillus pueri]|uniref:Ribonuclease M5 n=1 Tax=Pullulanibacillus pueri TaxID=1437324 RepID=A0A8J2ZZE2_9BACL|nr:ribonuclease M5 [Pullulanibacillus pueri]MBM7683998.1 ribonuclease M5 [Pullulanibacillus pueri]GGH88337.1 ribonuclease M5 [Pullulanibacillus pueri]
MDIKEIIVVEGKSDTLAINRALTADTIETNGSAINKQTLNAIRHAQAVRGVIVFTDPDVPGEQIRRKITDYVPDCKHAFIKKKEAFGGKNHSLGIEHAAPEVIIEALKKVYTVSTEQPERIPRKLLTRKGLVGGSRSKARRQALCERLNIGYTNGKQLYKRLRMFQITQERFEEALQQVMQEETNE